MSRSQIFLSAFLLVLSMWSAPLARSEQKEKPKFEMSEEEKTLLELTNKERAKEKLPPLEANPLLFKLARAHSANMAKKGEMNHVLDGKGPSERAKDAGYDYLNLAENVATAENTPLADVMKGWMESKIHRDNILGKEVTEIGLGVVRTEKGEYYFTQVFGRPKKK
jgi:uncharacterized protein YkwD